MKRHLKLIAAAILFAAPGFALAQSDAHHPPEASASAAPATPEATPLTMPMMMPMMQSCMGMMEMMQNHMGMMQMMHGMQMNQMMQMMQGMPMQGGMMGGNTPMRGGMMGGKMPMQAGMSESTQAYMAAMSKMDMPMMQGVQANDPDVAFVKGMIPHHQGAIDMAKAVLQFGKDEQVRTWANQIIAAQEKEIAEMQEWLKARGQ